MWNWSQVNARGPINDKSRLDRGCLGAIRHQAILWPSHYGQAVGHCIYHQDHCSRCGKLGPYPLPNDKKKIMDKSFLWRFIDCRYQYLLLYINGLVQRRCNSSTLAMDLCLFCTKTLIWGFGSLGLVFTSCNSLYTQPRTFFCDSL